MSFIFAQAKLKALNRCRFIFAISRYFDHQENEMLNKRSAKIFYLELSLFTRQILTHQCWASIVTRFQNHRFEVK